MTDAPHPSEFIFEELTARGWTVDELAEKMGYDPLLAGLAIDMYLAVGPDEPGIRLAGMAGGLARAFGTSPELWTNLEAVWLRAKEREG
jgi:plasmid maintenance system antidote protein VapI